MGVLPTKPFEEIGYVEAKGGVTVTKAALLDDMVQEARECGADGLINVEFYDRTVGMYEKPGAKAVMIHFKRVD